MQPENSDNTADERRKEIFKALVEAQDGGLSVADSYKRIADQYSVNAAEIKRIEREGLDGLWPPLE